MSIIANTEWMHEWMYGWLTDRQTAGWLSQRKMVKRKQLLKYEIKLKNRYKKCQFVGRFLEMMADDQDQHLKNATQR